MAASSRRDVVLNIYDLTDEHNTGSFARRLGLGAYHTGVEISGVEWTFAQKGIFFHAPKTPLVAAGQVMKLRESMVVATHVGSANEVHGVINKLREEFPPGSYHPSKQNCNHFSDRLCRGLVGAPIPAWINRPARIGGIFSWGGGRSGGATKGGVAKGEEQGQGKGRADAKAARQKKELTEEQKRRLEAVRRTGSS